MKKSLAIILIVLVFVIFLKRETQKPSNPPNPSGVSMFHSVTSNLETSVPSLSPASTAESLQSNEKEKLQILTEIFKSKNDNDPRMDHELKNLSPALKAAIQKQYTETKMELRNERGTIAFLIGRELKEGRGTLADIEFLKNVLMEKPCLSLSDCSKSANSQSIEEQHLEGVHETTAHYPQLIDLRYLKQSLESGNLSPEGRAAVILALEEARNSPNPRVSEEAHSILEAISPKNN